MPHVQNASAQNFHMQGVTFNSFITSANGGNRLAGWRTDFPSHTPGARHSMSEEETLYLLSGNLDVEIDEERFVAKAGDAILVPAGALFKIGNSTSEPAQAWVTTSVGMRATMHPSGDEIAPPWAQ